MHNSNQSALLCQCDQLCTFVNRFEQLRLCYAVKQLRAILIGGATSNHQTVVAAGRDGRASCLRQIHHFESLCPEEQMGISL